MNLKAPLKYCHAISDFLAIITGFGFHKDSLRCFFLVVLSFLY
jgi:hypothetical protein